MADSCCKSETACCEPPALVLPGPAWQALPAATYGTAEDTCCPKGVPVFDGMNPRYKLILWTVIGINGAMFVGEMVAGQLAGSQALKADALDFLADTVTYGLSLAVIGASLRTRATAALAKGVSLSLMALWVFGSTVYQTLILGLPKAEVMGVVGLLALAANLASVLLLRRYKDGDANVRSVWLCSRNDAIGNVIVMVAALAVWGTATAWPDLLVAAIMAGIFLTSSVQILRQAWSEYREGSAAPTAQQHSTNPPYRMLLARARGQFKPRIKVFLVTAAIACARCFYDTAVSGADQVGERSGRRNAGALMSRKAFPHVGIRGLATWTYARSGAEGGFVTSRNPVP